MTSTHLAPTTGLLPRKVKKSCTALTKSSKGAALPCPQEKQCGSCTALTEKQRSAALRPKTLAEAQVCQQNRVNEIKKVRHRTHGLRTVMRKTFWVAFSADVSTGPAGQKFTRWRSAHAGGGLKRKGPKKVRSSKCPCSNFTTEISAIPNRAASVVLRVQSL